MGSKRIQIVSDGRIEVTRTVLQVGTDIIEQNVNYIVDKGDRLKLSAAKTLNQFRTSGELAASKSFSLNFESADMNGEGRIIPVPPTVSPEKFRYECYLKDHLGSTRMVMNEDGEIVDAVAYQPYGEMVQLPNIAVTPELPARQKFTGKELDEEGPKRVGLIGIYVSFENTGDDWINGELELKLKDGKNRSSPFAYVNLSRGTFVTAGLTESFEEDVVIDQLIIKKNGFEYIVDDINCLVAKGKKQQITLENVTGDDIIIAAEEERNLFTFEAQVDGAPLAHMGLYYFGARFYDADVGVWISPDPKKDGWFAYGYVNGKPIILTDPNGEYGVLASALWGMASGAIGGAVYGGMIGGVISSAQGDSFWEGFENGAIVGGITGSAFGGIHGAAMNWGNTPVYNGLTGVGLQFRD